MDTCKKGVAFTVPTVCAILLILLLPASGVENHYPAPSLIWPPVPGSGFETGTEAQAETETELRRQLLINYDRTARPAATTAVRFRITLKHFDMIEEEQALMVDSWIVNEWFDPRLVWVAKDHKNISKLAFPYNMIWKPDLDVYNSAKVGEPPSFSDTLLIVFNNGRVLFVPPMRLQFSCVMDLTYWPHDSHNCTLIIGSWVHDGFAIDPQIMDDKPEIDIPVLVTESGRNLTRGSWELVEANMTRDVQRYECCPEPYVTIRVSILVTRNAPAYAWTVKLPAVGLSILTFVLFLLPPCAGEKIIFGGLCLILDVLFLAYTSNVITHAPSHTPLIIELVCEQLLLVVGSVVVAAVSTRLARDPHTSGLPSCLKRPLICLSTCLCLNNYKSLVSQAHQSYSRAAKTEEQLELGENGASHLYCGGGVDFTTTCGLDWLLLAAFIDRVSLIVFVIIFVGNMLAFKVVL
ncbi:neuronal acetylcholine receptor subunit alpha-2-like isoform X2 [Cherax quadricarinatus]|uniref:neuronal acetylcholine receptor subunit alpha-2-like isoform X2 n=1 Tax=Cherax quadricarinatus TaxID=27406 RepID=UPI00387EBEBC